MASLAGPSRSPVETLKLGGFSFDAQRRPDQDGESEGDKGERRRNVEKHTGDWLCRQFESRGGSWLSPEARKEHLPGKM
jgi:hypothetical protein